MIRPDLTASTSAVQQFAFDPNKELLSQVKGQNLQPTFQHSNAKNVCIKIVEQPVRLLKYRYKSDFSKRSPGSIYGENSCPQKTTYPAIQVMNCDIPFVVIVSCVTKDVYTVENRKGYLAHPHNLIGLNCKNGFCSLEAKSDTVRFSNIVIERVKEDEIAASLETRRKFRIDPYGMGFNHRDNIDLRVVRLCFQIYIKGQNDIYARTVSEPIYNKDVVSDLKIAYLSSDNAPLEGLEGFIILCPRVNEGSEVWFFEECLSRITWAKQATVRCIYKKIAVMCNVPPYFNPNATQMANVFVHLRNPLEDIVGEKRPFRYIARREAKASGFSSTFEFDPCHRISEDSAVFVPRTTGNFSLQEQNTPSASWGSNMLQEKSPGGASSVPFANSNTTSHNSRDWWQRYNFLQEQLKSIQQELNLMENLHKISSEEKNIAFTNEGQQQTKDQNTDELAEDVLNFFENLSTEDIIVDESQSTEYMESNVPISFNNLSDAIFHEKQSSEQNLEPNVPISFNNLSLSQIGRSNVFASNFQNTEYNTVETPTVPCSDAIKVSNLKLPFVMGMTNLFMGGIESAELEGIPQNLSESMYPSS